MTSEQFFRVPTHFIRTGIKIFHRSASAWLLIKVPFFLFFKVTRPLEIFSLYRLMVLSLVSVGFTGFPKKQIIPLCGFCTLWQLNSIIRVDGVNNLIIQSPFDGHFSRR